MEKYKNQIVNGIKGTILICMFLESGIIQILFKNLLHIKKVTVRDATILIFLSSLVFGIFLIIIYRKDLKKEWKIFKSKLSDNLDIGIKYWLIGLFFMMSTNILINLIWKSGTATNEQAVQKMITSLPFVMLLSAGILAPLNEEILFRKCFRDTFKNNIVFALASGIFFGFLHVSTATTLSQFIYIVPYSCLGISFAVMYIKTKSVFTSMMMHMAHNSILTLLSILL